MNIIQPLVWDTEFFNLKCGRVVLNGQFNEWGTLTDELDLYDFISIQNVDNEIETNERISELRGAFLADINIQFAKKVGKGIQYSTFDVYFAKDIPRKLLDSIKIEGSDFAYSKFECDKNFKALDGYKVYKEWIKNSLKSDNKYFLICEKDNEVISFILYSISEKNARIELVKVDKKYQSMGIATKMIRHLEFKLNRQKINELIVGTQVNNINAINLYHKLGFKETVHTSVFHLWKKERD